MDDLGPPVSYLSLPEGVPVFCSDGERIGTVAHVLAAEDVDIFDGLVLDVPGAGHRFADAPEVEELYERGAVLNIDAAAARGLPEPSENAATISATPDSADESRLGHKLRRAWDRISSNS